MFYAQVEKEKKRKRGYLNKATATPMHLRVYLASVCFDRRGYNFILYVQNTIKKNGVSLCPIMLND